MRLWTPIDGLPHVFSCSITDNSTFHAQSYYVQHPEGSVLVDAPPFNSELVDAIQDLGKPDFLFITHKDDIGQAPAFAEFFRSKVILHVSESKYYKPGRVHLPFEGDFMLHPDLAVVHLPGHTPGSSALLDLRSPGALFAGDAFNIKPDLRLYIPPNPWDFDPVLKRYSLRKLLNYDFNWIFPAHPPKPGMHISSRGDSLLKHFLKRIL